MSSQGVGVSQRSPSWGDVVLGPWAIGLRVPVSRGSAVSGCYQLGTKIAAAEKGSDKISRDPDLDHLQGNDRATRI